MKQLYFPASAAGSLTEGWFSSNL